MILTQTMPHAEICGALEEKFFGVQDLGMIFEILRSKLYSNPILAICREISCNARDAHREVGKFDEPIRIHLPCALEPDYKVKDHGPGISPDRIENVFIKYTASTKRNDNIQTGSFGIGAKVPWSYSDQFSIETIHDGIKYNYSCVIDESKLGKLVLLNKMPTDQPSGTTISIPVKPVDFNYFRSYTEQSCRHWDVKPIITGGTIVWQTLNKLMEGDGWAIAQSNDYNRGAKLIIDGIEYPLELEALRKYADPKLIDAASGYFVMYFNVGELSLSANREQIFLDKSTQDKIRTKMEAIVKVLRQQVEDKIASFPNLWEANLYYRGELSKAFSNIGFLGALKWNEYPLTHAYVNIGCTIFTFTKGKWTRRGGHEPDKFTRAQSRTLRFEENSVLYVNDLGLKEPSGKHVKKAFDDNPDLKMLQIICPNDKCKEDDLNKEIHLDQMNVQKLSSITKATTRTYRPCLSRLMVFKFDGGSFSRSSYDKLEEDDKKRVLCQFRRDEISGTRTPLLKNQTPFFAHSFSSILTKFNDVSFYGVDKEDDIKRLTEEFNDFIMLDDYLDQILNDKTDYVAIKYARNRSSDLNNYTMQHMHGLAPLITDPNSLLIKHYEKYKTLIKLAENTALLSVYEEVNGGITDAQLQQYGKDHPEHDVSGMTRAFSKKYPLMDKLGYYISDYVQHVAHYINAVDKL